MGANKNKEVCFSFHTTPATAGAMCPIVPMPMVEQLHANKPLLAGIRT
jgi:hypothetical protein